MSSSNNYQTPESKKEALTSVLVMLYEEGPDRPGESTEYLRKNIGVYSDKGGTNSNNVAAQSNETDKLRKENKELKNTVKELNKTIETLRSNLKHSREEARKARSSGQG
ncbi:hypothetical protein THAOC_03334 [Thalassiosira oceanica]|uniref:Uncharacterized protein n=1 Tax=Thalassiosira oceanica TaxID=159749 RepID=K0TCP1_THAOC|nr:hypothetical protein THAOC_03334 [Thalassiosira oceanica]|eukprot:EJK74959.1 hypothetical protein THAOC_03334 [Thalassiosira oceanica]